jgi:probable rRNA maturation factor
MPWLLGDVVLASGVVAREARAQRKSVKDHVSHLAVHGVLHLLGYDHERDGDAEAMEALEIATLAGMGIANPYEMRR